MKIYCLTNKIEYHFSSGIPLLLDKPMFYHDLTIGKMYNTLFYNDKYFSIISESNACLMIHIDCDAFATEKQYRKLKLNKINYIKENEQT